MLIPRNYSIKKGYQIREKNAPFPDNLPDNTTYQPDVYRLVEFIARRSGLEYIIDFGAGSGEKLKALSKDFNIIAVDCDPINIGLLKKNLPHAELVEYDFEKGLPDISPDILQKSIVITSDVIEHIIEPHRYLKSLSKISKISPYVLLSTPDRTLARGPEDFGPPVNPFHVREWSIDELFSLLSDYGIVCQIGHTVSNDRERFRATLLAIFGAESMCRESIRKIKLLSIMTVYNEQDILKQSVEHLIAEGSDVHIIDNWSTDDSFKIIKKLAKKHRGVTFEQFPLKRPERSRYEWTNLLRRVEELAKSSKKYDWIMHNDSDELRLPPWRTKNMIEAISFIDQLGYNAIDFTVINFRPTRDGFNETMDPSYFFFDFELVSVAGDTVQIKCWKNTGEVNLTDTGGHQAKFENQRVYPLKFLSKHYPLRSSTQAKRKIFSERIDRLIEEEKKKGWHIQYNHYKRYDTFLWKENDLLKFSPDIFYNEYLVERLSGIGIP